MFEVVHSEDLDVLTSAVYLAGLRVRERHAYPDWRTWLPLRPGGDEDPDALAAAARIIEDIEHAEGRPLTEISDRDLRPYERCVSDIVDERRRRERPYDPEEGERLLRELRERYGGPGGTPLVLGPGER